MFTINYIAKDTGLNTSFIRKCIKQLDNILKPHYIKGDSNQIQFTESGYVIFDQIKRLKEQGLNINVIKEHLEKQLHQQSKQEEVAIQSIIKHIPEDFDMFKKFFEEKETRLKEKSEYQQRIFELEHLSNHLKEQLLYITDGKSPEEYKNEWYKEKIEYTNLLNQAQLDKQRIAWILKELENLEGIFSVVNYFKRKKLYKELKDLMTKQANTTPNEQ